MIISESGLVRAIKSAYKTGYTVENTGNDVIIYTVGWLVRCEWTNLPRKVLAAIVEHLGMIPEKDKAVSIKKNETPQLVIESANEQLWGTATGANIACTPIVYQGLRLYQDTKSHQVFGVDRDELGIIDSTVSEQQLANITERNSVIWIYKDETIILHIGKSSGMAMPAHEQNLWNALERIDLRAAEGWI